MTTSTTQERTAQLEALGFALAVGTQCGEVGDNDWPCIAYNVALDYKGRKVMATKFKLGVGHVDWKKARVGMSVPRWTAEEENLIYTEQRHRGSSFKNKALQASVASKLAQIQGVKPTLADVLNSLISDGQAFFSAQSFEDWASEYGYDADSRKAEVIYRECDNTGRKLAAAIDPETLKAAREILADY